MWVEFHGGLVPSPREGIDQVAQYGTIGWHDTLGEWTEAEWQGIVHASQWKIRCLQENLPDPNGYKKVTVIFDEWIMWQNGGNYKLDYFPPGIDLSQWHKKVKTGVTIERTFAIE